MENKYRILIILFELIIGFFIREVFIQWIILFINIFVVIPYITIHYYSQVQFSKVLPMKKIKKLCGYAMFLVATEIIVSIIIGIEQKIFITVGMITHLMEFVVVALFIATNKFDKLLHGCAIYFLFFFQTIGVISGFATVELFVSNIVNALVYNVIYVLIFGYYLIQWYQLVVYTLAYNKKRQTKSSCDIIG